MLRGARIAVVVPAFQEARLIGKTLQSMPAFVDRIIVVDDASSDATSAIVRASVDPRVSLVRHETNRGVGAAIRTGYTEALRSAVDVLCVMAGDNQMHPDDLPALLEPILSGEADYVKGNRFTHPERRRMPAPRRFAGRVLASMTRYFTGLMVDDTQCGYTALCARAARTLPLSELWPRFGYPNDLLGMLASRGCRVKEVSVRPVYADEQSLVRPWHALLVAGVIVRRALSERASKQTGLLPRTAALEVPTPEKPVNGA